MGMASEKTVSKHLGSTFWGGGYLPSLSINYVAMSKDMGKRLPQLYYTKMKISYDLGFIAIGVHIQNLPPSLCDGPKMYPPSPLKKERKFFR